MKRKEKEKILQQYYAYLKKRPLLNQPLDPHTYKIYKDHYERELKNMAFLLELAEKEE